VTIHFTSDWHLNHENIIKQCKRPFDSLNAMNQSIIDNYNSIVKSNDTVYNLGDLFLKGSYDDMKGLIKQFNGNMIVVIGNHDNEKYIKRLLEDKLIKGFVNVFNLSVNNTKIWLSHYPHRSWVRSYHGSYHLHGHTHGKLEPYGLSFDVGVDCWDFKPVSFEQVVCKMKELKTVLI